MPDHYQQMGLEGMGPIDEIVGQVIELCRTGIQEACQSSFGTDYVYAGMAAGFRLLIADRTLIGGPGAGFAGLDEPDLAGDTLSIGPGNEVDPEVLRDSLVERLASLVGRGDHDAVPVLSSLAVHGGPFQAEAVAALAALDHPFEPVPEPKVVAAHLLTVLPGDAEEYVLELTYPGGRSLPDHHRAGIAIAIETLGRMPSDAMVIDDLDKFLLDAVGGPLPVDLVEVPVAEAIAAIDHSFSVFDHTLGAFDSLSDESDILMCRPMLDRLVATHPHPDYEPPQVDDAARAEAVRSFIAWTTRTDPDDTLLSESELGFVPLLIDFAADQAGDPMRWSRVVAIDALHMLCSEVLAPTEELAVAPDLLRLLIEWSHEELGWPSELTTEALDGIAEVEPLFEAELDAIDAADDLDGFDIDDAADIIDLGSAFGAMGSAFGPMGSAFGPMGSAFGALLTADLGQTGAGGGSRHLIEPPVGGEHPEPFDAGDLPAELEEKVAAVVAEADARATELFDAEFVTLVRRLIADAARHPESPLGRGRPTIWAGGAIYAVAQLNHIPGGWGSLALPSGEITAALDGAPATIVNKARGLRELLDLEGFPPLPRYQHSTSSSSTGNILSAIFGLAGGADPFGLGDLLGTGGSPDLAGLVDLLGRASRADQNTLRGSLEPRGRGRGDREPGRQRRHHDR